MVLVYIFARYYELLCLVGVVYCWLLGLDFSLVVVVWGGGFVCLVWVGGLVLWWCGVVSVHDKIYW